jgi:antitoxin ParD1/3/4
MQLHLTPELENLVENKVRAGRYSSPNEVIREALQLMEKRDQMLLVRKDEIRKGIAKGLESLRIGKGVDGEAAFARIEADSTSLNPTVIDGSVHPLSRG